MTKTQRYFHPLQSEKFRAGYERVFGYDETRRIGVRVTGLSLFRRTVENKRIELEKKIGEIIRACLDNV